MQVSNQNVVSAQLDLNTQLTFTPVQIRAAMELMRQCNNNIQEVIRYLNLCR